MLLALLYAYKKRTCHQSSTLNCCLHFLQGDPAPAAQQADVQRALDLVQQVAGQRGSSLLPPPASIAWAAAGSRRRTSLPVPPQPDVLNVADQVCTLADGVYNMITHPAESVVHEFQAQCGC